MKSYCTAQFKGWIPLPGEIVLPKSMTVVVNLINVGRDNYEARMEGAKKPFIREISTIYTYMQKLVSERFNTQLSPWVWKVDSGMETDPPDSEVFHQRKYPPDGPQADHTLCNRAVLVKRMAGGKQPVTCPDCRDAAQTNDSEMAKDTAARLQRSDPKLMHVRSTEGSQVGSVQTLCGISVAERYAEHLHLVVKNHGKRVTCLACEFAAERIASESPSVVSGGAGVA